MPPHPSLRTHLRTIRRSTRLIARAVTQLASQVRRVEREATRKTKAPSRKTRKLRITPKRRAQLKLQGAYIDVMDSPRDSTGISVRESLSPQSLSWGGGVRNGTNDLFG